jgi:hypothetical protein
VVVQGLVILCKIGSSATFNVTTPGGNSTVTLTDGGSTTILSNPTGANQTASTSEQAQSGIRLDSIVVVQGQSAQHGDPLVLTSTVFTGTSNASGIGGNETGALITYYNTILPPPPVGCTFTQGYWKNHTNVWPSPYSPTATFFTSGQTWITNLNTPPKGGNAYYILSHQYIAAVLNGANGASAPASVAAAIATATTYFQNPSASNLTSADLIALADLLDQYNNGLAGVPHC